MTFALSADSAGVLPSLDKVPIDAHTVVALGAPLVETPGLRSFPVDVSPFPATQGALWAFLGHPDPSQRFDAGRRISKILRPALRCIEDVGSFRYRGGRDLSGFEDGTENPKGKKALAAAFLPNGGSFVAVQRWRHDLDAIDAMTDAARDDVIGRRRKTNVELEGAPASAHVKRTAQETFDPPAFLFRRSMPWGGADANGLYFIAYGSSLDAFERQLLRMSGRQDGVRDALFTFSTPLTGGYYFCPPLRRGRLDLRAVTPRAAAAAPRSAG